MTPTVNLIMSFLPIFNWAQISEINRDKPRLYYNKNLANFRPFFLGFPNAMPFEIFVAIWFANYTFARDTAFLLA